MFMQRDAIDLPSIEGGAPLLNLGPYSMHTGKRRVGARLHDGWVVVLQVCLSWLRFFFERAGVLHAYSPASCTQVVPTAQ